MVRTQLIAHDKEVFDIAFSRAGGGRDIFASVGADGSVRMFDLRLVILGMGYSYCSCFLLVFISILDVPHGIT